MSETIGLAIRKTGIGFFLLAGSLAAFGPMSIDMYLPALPTIANDLETNVARVETTLVVFFLGFAIAQFFYGPLSDRFGRRPILLWTIAFYVLASVACAAATTIEQLTWLRLLQALGGGAGGLMARAMARDLFEGDDVARALTFIGMVMALAPLLAPFIGGYALAWFGWRAIFWLLGGFGLISWLAVVFFARETLPPQRRTGASVPRMLANYVQVLRDRDAMGYICAGGFAFAGMFAYIAGTPYVYIVLFDVPAEHFGLLFGVNILAMMVLGAINARLLPKLGYRRLLAIGAWIASLGGAALLVCAVTGWFGLAGIVVPLLFNVGMLGLVGANAMAGTLRNFAHIAGTATALFSTLQFLAGSLTSTFVAEFHDGTAIPMAATIAVTSVLAVISLHVLTDRRS